MKPFPYDEFYPVFMEEVKSIFSQFITHNKEKKPYIFIVSATNYIAENHPKSHCLWANGNTIVDFESTRFSYENPTAFGLIYKYSSDEWSGEAWRNKSFTINDFSKANSIILNYVIENENMIEKDDQFTEEFETFRTDFFCYLIKCLKQLRDENFFDSVYSEKILINLEVREYYTEEEMIRIFEYLNTKEEATLYAQWLI